MTAEQVREPKFEVGQLVRHRASGEAGIVIKIKMRCGDPDHASPSGAKSCDYGALFRGKPTCHTKFTGEYVLATRFEVTTTALEEELER